MKLNKMLLTLIVVVGIAQADVQSNIAKPLLTAELRGSQGNKEAALDELMKKIETIGYTTVAVNKNIQNHYYNKFQEKNVEMLSFFSMINKEKMRPLLLSNPDFGAYAPFNFLAYKTLDSEFDNNTWYGHLDPDTMLGIMDIKDDGDKKAFKEMLSEFDTLVEKELAPKFTKKFEHTKPLPKKGLIKFVKTFEATDDIEEFMEEFIMDHDGNFAKREFVIAGFIDLKFEYDDMELKFEKYDAYWVSLLCHFEFSNAIFNRGVPEGALFAPCSVYFYIPKGTNELHVGYAGVENWINALNFRDQKRIDYMRAIDQEVQQAFEEMGFIKVVQRVEKTKDKTVEVKMPKTDDKNSELETVKSELKKVKTELETLKQKIKELLN